MYTFIESAGLSPAPCRKISVVRMPFWSAKDSAIIAAFFGPMPGISVRRWGSLSSTSSVSTPKRFTISFAIAGPTPLISPEARYFSTPLFVSGRSSS